MNQNIFCLLCCSFTSFWSSISIFFVK